MSVVCLAARAGGEVRAFVAVGAFAVGVDLAPANSEWVLTGDFHQLQWKDGCVDVVYCNSFDHAYDLARLVGETRRVLRPGGLLVAEIAAGSSEGTRPGPWEALWWDHADDVVEIVEQEGFTLVDRSPFDTPWLGHHCRFRRP